ncbi:MAG: TetR/AcrR family transcriptional regulator C-terminal domain-containing protein [Herpetosiphonaceae bacterium]|nr:TetR/AcrR family transcriptional regulator C-terminal domain-containing protein [Herpetosiphonaceae bacterium]
MPLQRETVARAALRLLNEVGLDNLTMRRLATYLDIQNPSLYWHFRNKQELLNCMAALMIAEAFTELQSPEPEQDWANWLATWARRLRKTMLAYRDGARVLAEANLLLNDFFEVIELALNILQHAGFDESTAASGMIMVIHYVMGAAFELQADPSFFAYRKGEESPRAIVDEERFPRIVAFFRRAEVLSSTSAETWFEEGLSLLLDGLRANLAKEHPNATSG